MIAELCIETEEPRRKKQPKPLTARLRKSKNFWKEDRMLDDFIDRTKLIKIGPKTLLRKLLKLRSREDSNDVKVTVSGLSKLLAVDPKTIRRGLKALEQAGFIIPQQNIWDDHYNYAKKRYTFPLTFPGFDLSTVFIRRGAKMRHKAKQAQTSEAAQASNSQCVSVRKITSPVLPGLIDCSSSTRTETCNSSSEEIASQPTLKPAASRRADLFLKKRHEPCLTYLMATGTPVNLFDFVPKLEAVLNAVLSQAGSRGQVDRIRRFIEQCCDESSFFKHPYDRICLAFELERDIADQFLSRIPTRNVLVHLFRFIRNYVMLYTPPSLQGDSWDQFLTEFGYELREIREGFYREYARLDTEKRSGINRY